ncbi:unnamed protein product [Hermetia illucens]|uniref:Uncharacterized protein n=1 Tax=Hermetia illucens TaxID=343691 RepID=A0A7R8UCF5_HERIL|nr:unnamed protein product [Hermetia illucens]
MNMNNANIVTKLTWHGGCKQLNDAAKDVNHNKKRSTSVGKDRLDDHFTHCAVYVNIFLARRNQQAGKESATTPRNQGILCNQVEESFEKGNFFRDTPDHVPPNH